MYLGPGSKIVYASSYDRWQENDAMLIRPLKQLLQSGVRPGNTPHASILASKSNTRVLVGSKSPLVAGRWRSILRWKSVR